MIVVQTLYKSISGGQGCVRTVPSHLKVRRSVDGAGVVILIERRPERSATSRTGCLFANTGADGGAAHEVGRIVFRSGTSTSTNSPGNHTNSTEKNGTTNTHDNTNDDILLVRVQTRVGVIR